MKKVLTSFAAVAAAMAVNAQTIETAYVNVTTPAADGTTEISGTATLFPTGTVFCTSENVTAILPSTEGDEQGGEKIKSTSCVTNGVKYFVFNGTDTLRLDKGVTGNFNGMKNTTIAFDGKTSNATVDKIAGMVVKITPKQDGFIYAVSKVNGNKNTFVYEEDPNAPLSWSQLAYVMAINAPKIPGKNSKGEQLYTYGGAMDENGVVLVNLNTNEATPATDGFVTPAIAIPTPGVLSGATPSAGEDGIENGSVVNCDGVGVIAFPVFGGYNYYVYVAGSKMSFGGYAFTTKAVDVTSVVPAVAEKVAEDGTVTPAVEGKSWKLLDASVLAMFNPEGENAINNVVVEMSEVEAVKTIENGKIVIIKNGVKYNAAGMIVK